MISHLDDLSLESGAFRARKRPIAVSVVFAKTAGAIDTREGLVCYEIGDALLTGVEQEKWPVQRDRFIQTYEPMPHVQVGEPGHYIKRPLTVWCLRVDTPESIALGANRGVLHASPGDVIVQYQPGDLAVVGSSIFGASYESINESL